MCYHNNHFALQVECQDLNKSVDAKTPELEQNALTKTKKL
jgi:hypothetical protein